MTIAAVLDSSRRWHVEHGSMEAVLATMPDCSIDSCVTDPPYELGFMNRAWDKRGVAFDPDTWRQVLRVLKPGGHLLAFGGTRTYHRIACAIEDAGFEIRDCIFWAFGSGMPKSLDIGKAIDKAAGAEREVVGSKLGRPGMSKDGSNQSFDSSSAYGSGGVLASDITAPATDDAKRFHGYGTGIKPSLEPCSLARKPLIGTVAANVLEHGTGGLNINACKIALDETEDTDKLTARSGGERGIKKDGYVGGSAERSANLGWDCSKGRWPANLVHDGSDEVVALFPSDSPGMTGGGTHKPDYPGGMFGGIDSAAAYGDNGSAARFFYCAKASREERDLGLRAFGARSGGEVTERKDGSAGLDNPRAGAGRGAGKDGRVGVRNLHPT